MPDTLWNPAARESLARRLDNLLPESKPRWGKFNSFRMLAHLTDWMRMARGEITIAPRSGILRSPAVKLLAIYILPFPKGVPTAPELIARSPEDLSAERNELKRYLAEFENAHRAHGFPEHPAFGHLSSKTWGVLAYRHTDHHFTQFGI
jgi:hypothetical protein